MKNWMVLISVLAFSVAGCAATPTTPAGQVLAARGLHQPTDAEDMRCKVMGLLFQDLAALRDDGFERPAAVAEASARLRSLAVSAAEKRDADYAVAMADSSAGLVYVYDDIRPEAMMNYGANLCLIAVVGNHDPDNALRLANDTYACQEAFADRIELRQCVVDRAFRLAIR